jgi:hypothetical protein
MSNANIPKNSSKRTFSRATRWLGKNSYELYLFHVILLALMRTFVKQSDLGFYTKPIWFLSRAFLCRGGIDLPRLLRTFEPSIERNHIGLTGILRSGSVRAMKLRWFAHCLFIFFCGYAGAVPECHTYRAFREPIYSEALYKQMLVKYGLADFTYLELAQVVENATLARNLNWEQRRFLKLILAYEPANWVRRNALGVLRVHPDSTAHDLVLHILNDGPGVGVSDHQFDLRRSGIERVEAAWTLGHFAVHFPFLARRIREELLEAVRATENNFIKGEIAEIFEWLGKRGN